MKRTLYLQMLFTINMHRTWIVADKGSEFGQRIIFKHNRAYWCTCRILRLRSLYRHGNYEKGTTWGIPEYELDKALARYRRSNISARHRLQKGASYLEAKDVDAIIETATHGLLKLELTELPLFRQ
jgi:hypothetical protein